MSRVIGLVGCVKEKADRAQTAKNLYTSTLFVGRRRYVERTCDEWWILSAMHGLVHPDAVVEPYDLALKSLSASERRRWSGEVLAAIDEEIRPQPGDTFEMHAGAEYRSFGLEDGLVSRGCRITNPTGGLRIGHQLSFYSQGPS